MKYYKWNLMFSCGAGTCNIIIGMALLFVHSEKWLCILGAIAVLVFIISLICTRYIKHDIYDEASMETELNASLLSQNIVLGIIAFLMILSFLIRRPVENMFPIISIFYGIVYMLPAICFAYYERKMLKGINDCEFEE